MGRLQRHLDSFSRVADWLSQTYLAWAAAVALGVVWLQYHEHPSGLMLYYELYRRIILAEFDPTVAQHGCPTFPMWGYGWVLVLTQNKLPLLLFQNALGIFSLWFFVRTVERYSLLRLGLVKALKIIAAFSLPYYAYHSGGRCERGIAVGLFLLSFSLLLQSSQQQRGSLWKMAVSGALFGLMLNFRSDYYLMPLGLGALLIVHAGFARAAVLKTALWLGMILAMLVPWMLYTRHVTGTPLLTSTNAGHVLFIGLGTRPGNKWGITPMDNDPKMADVVRQQYGEGKHTCGREADVLLRRKWWEYVRGDPLEYLRGCFHSLCNMVIGGVYSGNFDPEFGAKMNSLLVNKSLNQITLGDPLIFRQYLNFRVFMNLISEFTGRIVVFSTFLFYPFVVFRALRKRDLFMLLVCASIAYQWALNMFGYNARNYMTNMYVFYLVCLVSSLIAIPVGRRRLPAVCTEPGSKDGDFL